MSTKQYEAYQKVAKEKLFKLVDKIQSRNTQYSEDEVLKDVTREVEEVRCKR